MHLVPPRQSPNRETFKSVVTTDAFELIHPRHSFSLRLVLRDQNVRGWGPEVGPNQSIVSASSGASWSQRSHGSSTRSI